MTDVFVMPFGKHKGKPITQVPAGYLTWMLDLPNLRPDTRKAIESYLHPPELPMEGREPEESEKPRPRSSPRPDADGPAPATCATCGQPATDARPLVHADCARDPVPF